MPENESRTAIGGRIRKRPRCAKTPGKSRKTRGHDAAADKADKVSEATKKDAEEQVGTAANQHLHHLGDATWPMPLLDMHKHLFLTDLECLIILPLSLGQACIRGEKSGPAAYASWAYVSDAAADHIAKAGHGIPRRNGRFVSNFRYVIPHHDRPKPSIPADRDVIDASRIFLSR